MLVRGSVFVSLVASLISGLLCCSDQGVKAARYEGAPSRRSEAADEFFYRAAYRRPSSAPRPYHQDADGYENEKYNSYVRPTESNYDYYSEDHQEEEEEEVQRGPSERSENGPSMETSASHSLPVKSERTASRFSGSSYKSGYGAGSYSITLQPGAVAITCTVKDPLEHIVWLRTLCPDEYERGDVIARGSVSNFPDVFSVSVSGSDGEFTSTLSIDKPRTQMGSGVFRCEAWPHHQSDHHRRHRRQAGRESRGHHNPWNAIILGGAEMVDECFYNHYGDKWRQYRAMEGRTPSITGNEISASDKPAEVYQQYQEVNQTTANLFPELSQPQADYEELLKLLQETGTGELADLATADLSHVPQVENRRRDHHHHQRPHPVYVPTPNMAAPQPAQPFVHFQSRRVNLQSGGQDVRADVEMSTDLRVHPPASRVAVGRMIQVQGDAQQ